MQWRTIDAASRQPECDMMQREAEDVCWALERVASEPKLRHEKHQSWIAMAGPSIKVPSDPGARAGEISESRYVISRHCEGRSDHVVLYHRTGFLKGID